MNWITKAIGLGGPAVPGFNFDLGTQSGTAITPGICWTLRGGTNLDDKADVTIFELQLNGADTATIDLARAVCKRAKRLMLPGFLRCYEAVEHNEVIYMACEPCTPLPEILDQRDIFYEDEPKFHNAVALGLHAITNGLIALHKNNLVYNNVNAQSIYVTKSGEWRLFGHEFVCGFDEEHSLFRRYLSLMPENRHPPESANSTATVGGMAGAIATDAWGIGALIYEVFSGKTNGGGIKGTDMKQSRVMPRTLQPGFVGLTGSNPKLRMTLEKFLADTAFINDSEYVSAMLSLEELNLKDAVERDAFYRNLCASVDDFPLRACKYIILEKLNIAVQFGGSSAAALEPILKIGARLDEHEFGTLVAPVVVSLFSSPDHLIRCRLLAAASQYAKLLPSTLVCDKIWPHYVSGFTNKNADLRELSVRSLVHFAPLLNEQIITTDAVKGITTLQQDREGPIRTNATICLGLIAPHFPEANRSKILVNGFGRMLRDPFIPSKVAALRCIGNCQEYLASLDTATQLMPAVSPAAIDANSEVREAALKTLTALIGKLEAAHAELPRDEPVTAESTVATSATSVVAPVAEKQTSSTSSAPAVAPAPAPAAKPKSSGWGWGSTSSLDEPAPQQPANDSPAPSADSQQSATPPVMAAPVRKPLMKKKTEDQHGDPAGAVSPTPAGRTGGLKLGGAKKKGFGGAASKAD